MYDLHYTFLTELEVDTRQSFDDLSDDLLLLDKNAEESQVVNMKSVISSWQNYFWKSPNTNKQLLDITFTDLSIDRGSVASTDYQGNPLNDLEMMSFQELLNFFQRLDSDHAWAGGRTWAELSIALCNAITALQRNYVDIGTNIYPLHSVLVTNENPNNAVPGVNWTWTSRSNCYLSEVFSSSNYGVSPGYNQGCGSLNDAELKDTATKPPIHNHKISYLPASGSGGGSSEGSASPASTPVEWYNTRRGLDKTPVATRIITGGHGASTTVSTGRWKFSGSARNNTYAATVARDANDSIGADGGGTPTFTVSSAEKKAADSSIKVAPKTYPPSSLVWERTQ